MVDQTVPPKPLKDGTHPIAYYNTMKTVHTLVSSVVALLLFMFVFVTTLVKKPILCWYSIVVDPANVTMPIVLLLVWISTFPIIVGLILDKYITTKDIVSTVKEIR